MRWFWSENNRRRWFHSAESRRSQSPWMPRCRWSLSTGRRESCSSTLRKTSTLRRTSEDGSEDGRGSSSSRFNEFVPAFGHQAPRWSRQDCPPHTQSADLNCHDSRNTAFVALLSSSRITARQAFDRKIIPSRCPDVTFLNSRAFSSLRPIRGAAVGAGA